jgi:hypothetical protein
MIGAGWAGVTGTPGETADGAAPGAPGVTTTGGVSPGITIMPCPVAGGGTVVRKNGLVAGCELRQPASAAMRRTAQGHFIGQTPAARP